MACSMHAARSALLAHACGPVPCRLVLSSPEARAMAAPVISWQAQKQRQAMWPTKQDWPVRPFLQVISGDARRSGEKQEQSAESWHTGTR